MNSRGIKPGKKRYQFLVAQSNKTPVEFKNKTNKEKKISPSYALVAFAGSLAGMELVSRDITEEEEENIIIGGYNTYADPEVKEERKRDEKRKKSADFY